MHMNNRVRKSDWSDSISGDPIGDVRAAVAESDVFGHVVLYLTRDSIRDLMVHPDMSRMWRHDWKYLLQVDEVKMSASDVDYIQSGEQEPQKWQPIETAPRDGRTMFVAIAINVQGVASFPYTSDPWIVWRYPDGGLTRWPHAFSPTHWMPLPEPPK